MTRSAEELQDTMVRLGEADGNAAIAGPGVPTQFLEATVYNKYEAVVQTGEYVDAPSSEGVKVGSVQLVNTHKNHKSCGFDTNLAPSNKFRLL